MREGRSKPEWGKERDRQTDRQRHGPRTSKRKRMRDRERKTKIMERMTTLI